MLSSVLYEHLRDVAKLPFVETDNAKIHIIAPSPAHADKIRNLLHEDRKSSVDVITVAKFIRDHYGNYHKKADLMVKLAAVWQQLLPDSSFEEYMRAFNLFTELRSFTLDKTLVLDILDDFDDRSKLAVLLLWSQFDELQLDDEQGAYQAISDKYIEFDYESIKDDIYIFWGFQFLAGTQVDLIQNIATKHEVFVPIPKYVYENASDFDWVKWIRFHNQVEISTSLTARPVKITRFPKNYLNQYLDSLQGRDIYLTQRNLSINEIMELPGNDLIFRSPVDILESELTVLLKWLEQFRNQTRKAFEDSIAKQLSVSIESSNFQKLKCLLLVQNAYNQVADSRPADNLSYFDEKLIKSITKLNAPRNFFVPLVTNNMAKSVSQLNTTFYGLNPDSIVVGHSQYSSLYQHFETFSVETQKKLATIAPVKRADFELLYIKDNLQGLAKNGLHLYLETGLEVSDIGWAEILEELDFEEEVAHKKEVNKKVESSLHQLNKSYELKTLSAKKLQSYIDCSMRFYYQYVDKKSPFLELKSFVSPRERGVLQHKVIELYCNRHHDLNEEALKELVVSLLQEHIKNNNKEVSSSEYQTSLFEILNYSRHGVELIFNLKEELKPKSIEFEQLLQNQDNSLLAIDGSVDCVVETDSEVIILDFKRSKYSVPSKSEIEKLQKIQLWFYAKHGKFRKPVAGIGYINLAEPELSSLYCLNDNLQDRLSNIVKCVSIKSELSAEYDALELESVQKINSGVFYASPLKKEACQFCFINKVCEKNG